MQKAFHLLLGPDLTNSSRTTDNSNVRPLEQLRHDLPHIDRGNIMPAETYLKQYCNRPVEMDRPCMKHDHFTIGLLERV